MLNKPCPKCRELGRDKDGNNLFLMSNGKGYVCRQNGVTHKPYYEWLDGRTIEKEEKETYMDVSSIQELPFRSLDDRKIKESTCKFYDVRVALSEETGEVETHYYPLTKQGQITAYKLRTLPKQFSVIGDSRGNVELFGQQPCPKSGKRLLITGGELDCLAAFQMLKEKYPQYTPSVVSLPKGENTSSIKDNLEFIKAFEEVIIYTDMDEPGRKAADDIAKLIGPKAKIMSTSEKDASDMLKFGKQAEFFNSFFSAQGRRPEGIIKLGDIPLEKLKEETIVGYDLPYPKLNAMLGGLRKGELTTFTAGSSVGKSTLVREIGYHLAFKVGLKVGSIFLEEPIEKTAKGYIALDNNVPLSLLRKSSKVLSDEEWEASYIKLQKMPAFNHFGSLPTEDLLDKMRYMAYGEGCDFIIVDHLSLLFSGQKNENERLAIDNALTELAAFTNESGCGILVVVHLSRNKQKQSFNEGGQVSLTDLRGSAALEQLSWNVIALERDMQAEEDRDKNKSIIRVLKNRENAFTGIADTCVYNFTTGRLLPEVLVSEY